MGLGQKIRSLLLGTAEALPYDNITQESKSLSVQNDHFVGGRSDFTKKIANFQISTNILLNKSHFLQVSSLYSTQNLVVQSTFDQDMSWQNRICGKSRGFIGRLHTLYSKRNVFSQLELNKSVGNTNFGAKIISPAIPSIKSIYVFNFLSKIGKYHLGMETIFSRGQSVEVGLGMNIRKETDNTVTVIGIQQLTAIAVSHFRQISPRFSAALDLNYSLLDRELLCSAAWKLQTKRASVRTQIDTTGKVTSVVENRVTDNLLVSFSSEVDLWAKTNSFGISFSLA